MRNFDQRWRGGNHRVYTPSQALGVDMPPETKVFEPVQPVPETRGSAQAADDEADGFDAQDAQASGPTQSGVRSLST
jgi:hypothetical protein